MHTPKVAKCPNCLTPSNTKAINAQLLEALELLYLGVSITGGIFSDTPLINLDSEIAVKARAAIELTKETG